MNPNLPYSLARVNEPKKGLRGVWYVYFFYEHPDTGKRRQFIIKNGINYERTITGRRKYGHQLASDINRQLEQGWSPYGKSVEKHLTIKEVLDGFVEQKKATLRRRSWQSYKYSADLLTGWLERENAGYISPVDFTPAMCRQFFDYLLGVKKYSGITFNSHKSFLSTFWNMMIEREIVEKNPFKKIRNQQEVSGKNLAFTPGELKTVNEYLILNNYRLYLFTQFIYFCYIRPIEILRLKIENIDLEGRQIMIFGAQNKNHRQQAVEIPDAFIPLVKGMNLHEYPKEFYLFGRRQEMMPGEKPLHRNRVSGLFKEVKDELKLNKDHTMYGYKATGNVSAYKEGIDIYNIMKQNRHHSIEQTMTYLRSLGLIRNTEFSSKMK